jgi:hypothetical protein
MIRGKFLAQDDFDLAGHRLRNWKWLDDLPTDGAEEGQVPAYVGGKVVWSTISTSGVVSVAWDDITGKPATFPPSDHTHPWDEVTGKPTFVNSITASTGIDINVTTGNVQITCDLTWSELADKPTEFTPEAHTHSITELTDYNAITALNAGTNIAVSGATVSVVATPTFDGTVNVGGNLIIDGNIDCGGDIALTMGGPISGATTITAGKLVSTADISAVDDVTANNNAYFMGGDRRGFGVQVDSFVGGWVRGLYFYDGSTVLGAHYGYGTGTGILTRMGIAQDYNVAAGLHVQLSDGFVGIGDLTPSYELDVAGDMRATGTVQADVRVNTPEVRITGDDMFIGYDGADTNQSIYFREGGSNTGRRIRWDNTNNRFDFNDSLRLQGNAQVDGFLALNYSGPDGDSVIYFYEDSSTSGAELRFDDSANEFSVNHRLRVDAGVENLALALESSDANCYIQLVDDTGYANITESSSDIFMQPGGNNAAAFYSSKNTRCFSNLTVDGNMICDGIVYAGQDTGVDFCLRLNNNDEAVGMIMTDDGGSGDFYYNGNVAGGKFYLRNNADTNILTVNATNMDLTGNVNADGNVDAGGELTDSLRDTQGSNLSVTAVTPVDTSLQVPVKAGARYLVDGIMLVSATNALAPDLALTWSVPTGAVFYWHEGLQDGGQNARTTAKGVLESNGTTVVIHRIGGVITTASTAGNLLARAGQNTSSGNAVTLRATSVLKLERIS